MLLLDIFATPVASQEILFGPLTGLEVRATREDGTVLVVEAALSINLASLTMEQVCVRMAR